MSFPSLDGTEECINLCVSIPIQKMVERLCSLILHYLMPKSLTN